MSSSELCALAQASPGGSGSRSARAPEVADTRQSVRAGRLGVARGRAASEKKVPQGQRPDKQHDGRGVNLIIQLQSS